MTPLPHLHVIVPNTTSATLLRVFKDFTETCPIIAWRIEHEEIRRKDGTTFDSTGIYPISFEAASSNCVELIVFEGQWFEQDNTLYVSLEQALEACRNDPRVQS